jgi:hypothetical protein
VAAAEAAVAIIPTVTAMTSAAAVTSHRGIVAAQQGDAHQGREQGHAKNQSTIHPDTSNKSQENQFHLDRRCLLVPRTSAP